MKAFVISFVSAALVAVAVVCAVWCHVAAARKTQIAVLRGVAEDPAATPTGKPGGDASPVAELLRDPARRKEMREEQRLIADQKYGLLFQQMGLAPAEADRFKDMVADLTMAAAQAATALFAGGGASDRAAAIKRVNAQQQAFEGQLKAFLGPARYAQYRAYEETVNERMLLNLFKQQAGSDYTLSDSQGEALLIIMKEERQNAATATAQAQARHNQGAAAPQDVFSDDNTAQVLQTQASINQRVYERARTILSADQLTTLARFQAKQLQVMREGMGTMRTAFGGS